MHVPCYRFYSRCYVRFEACQRVLTYRRANVGDETENDDASQEDLPRVKVKAIQVGRPDADENPIR